MSKKKFAKRQIPGTTTAPLTDTRKIKKVSLNQGMVSWFVALLLLLPVIFSRDAQDPSITPRYILLSFFIGLFTLFFYVFNKTGSRLPYPTLVKYVFIFGAGFTIWSMICLAFSVNPTAGFYEVIRPLLQLVLLFFIIEMIASDDTSVLKICKVFVVIGLIQSLVGILQFYHIAFLNLPGANALPYGLMANRNLFGSAQVFVIPFVVFVLYKASKRWKYASVISLIGLVVSIILSQTRSAWLGAVAILIVALILVLVFSPIDRKKWVIGTISSLFIILSLAGLLMATDSEGGLRQQVKERTASLVNATPDSAFSKKTSNDRLRVWKKTTSLIKDHPLIGVGPSNWKLNILAYGSSGLAWAEGYYVPDRVHNVFLQTAAETGFPGVFLYLTFWLIIVIAAFKVIAQPASGDQRIIVILMLSGLAAFAVDSMFSFPTERIEHMLYVMLMAGIVLGSFIANKNRAQPTTKLKNWLPGIFIFIAFINGMMGIKKYSFEKNLKYAIAYDQEKRYQEVQSYVLAGKNSWINVDQLGQSLEARNAIAYKAQKNYPMALEQMNIAMKLNPNSALVYNNMGTIYTEMNDFKKAIPYYEKALQLTPDFEIVKKNLALNYYNVGNYKGTVKTLENVKINDDPFLVNIMNESKKLAANQP
jgi:O-antigen ligase